MSTTQTHPEAGSVPGGGRGANWKAIVASSALPAGIVAVISTVVSRARLWPSERADVARELVAHFKDGLDRGRSADELVRDFGDPRAAGRRIGKAARGKRPWTWQVWRRGSQAVAAGLAVTVVGYGVLAARFAMGEATITRNIASELNAPIREIPEADRAWPAYRAVLIGSPDAPGFIVKQRATQLPVGIYEIRIAAPGQPAPEHWAEAQAWTRSIASELARIRAISRTPRMGYLLTNAKDPGLVAANAGLNARVYPDDVPDNNPVLWTVLLEPLGYMRAFARDLSLDAQVALSEGDSARAVENLATMLRIARQVDGMEFLISDLVAIGIADLAWRTTQAIVETRLDALSDADLAQLAAEFARDQNPGALRPNLASEGAGFEDALQRLFTDDGGGDGRLTPEGFAMVTRMSEGYVEPDTRMSTEVSLEVHALGPVSVALTASRKETRARWEQIMAEVAAIQALPMWEWAEHPSAPTDRFSDEDKARYPVLAVLVPGAGSAIEKSEFAHQRRDAVTVAVALERFRRATGAYPASLDALVPAYLASVPRDLMDGEPLRYRLTESGPLVYSVGMDRVDNDGRQARDADGKPVTHQPWMPVADARARQQAGGFASQLVYDGDMVLYPTPR